MQTRVMNELRLSGENLTEMLDFLLSGKTSVPVRTICYGYSMSPFIKDGDSVVIAPAAQNDRIPIGKIVLAVKKKQRRVIIHRVICGNKNRLQLKGDNNRHPDGWFSRKNILGTIVAIEHKKGPSRLPLFMGPLIAIASRSGLLTPGLNFLRKVRI